jgi:tricorn protease
MTSYPYNETFGLYFAILRKGEATPLLPESDEDTGVQSSRPAPGGGQGGRGGRGGGSAEAGEEPPASQAAETPRTPPRPVTVQIDFDDIHRRIISVPGVPVRQYSQLRAGLAGTVYYLEAGGGAAGGGGGGGGGSTLHRYRLSDRRAAPFVSSVADYEVSADGRKLLYRSGGGGGGRGGRGAGGAAGAGPGLFVVDADRTPPQANAGRLDVQLRMYLEPKAESSRRAGATSATTSTCRTCTAPTGRRWRRCTDRCCRTSTIAPI